MEKFVFASCENQIAAATAPWIRSQLTRPLLKGFCIMMQYKYALMREDDDFH